MSRMKLIVGLGCGLINAEILWAQSTLVPITTRRDHVFAPTGGLIYISTTAGTIARYNLATSSFLSPWAVGVSLNGLDVVPNGTAVYVAEDQVSGGQGMLRKVNTSNGAVTNLPYALTALEAGAWDVKIANNGKGLMSTKSTGSAWVPLREVNLATDTLAIRTDVPGSGFDFEVRNYTQINRGADRSLFFMTESDSSAGPFFTYVAGTDTFPESGFASTFLSSSQSAVNRNGSLIAYESSAGLSILNPALDTVHVLSANLNGGMIFDPVLDILYAANSVTDRLVAFNTNTWTELFQLNIGENISTSSVMGAGVMSISDDGSRLAMSTPAGMRLFAIPEPAYCGLLGMAFLVVKRRRSQNR